ncbi:hypothetical protein D3C84_1239680 [compost metagenome]
MHVQLTDNVTQGRNVHLVGIERILQRFSQGRCLLPQLLLLGDTQLKYLTDIVATRHQDEPGVIRIVGQQ